MGANDNEDFVVEDPTPELYNLNRAVPPLWEPQTTDLLSMFHILQSGQVLSLKWHCPGRHAPKSDVVIMQCISTYDRNADHVENRNEATRCPEPSAFDFDDALSETCANMKMTPRTPVFGKTKQPEKRVARMDNVLNSLKRQQKAEREARKSYQGSSALRTVRSAAAGSPCLQNPASPMSSSPRSSLVASGEFMSGTAAAENAFSTTLTATQTSVTVSEAVRTCFLSEAYAKPFHHGSGDENSSLISQPVTVESIGNSI